MSAEWDMDAGWAFLGWSDGRVLVGQGPFEMRAEMPADGVAFYCNRFGLDEAQPWRIPATYQWMTKDEVADVFGATVPQVSWGNLEATSFADVFSEVTESIHRGTFEKTVPVVVEQGQAEHHFGSSLAAVTMNCEAPLVPYGMSCGEDGFVGQSPEYLLRVNGRRVSTMALAGTARAEERDVLAVDQKEIREHEFVAQALVSKLGDLGQLERGERDIMTLGEIVHFHTPITVELDQPLETDRLIRRLHPTPALGPLPRTKETMQALISWRERLGAPAEFGAPFGAVVDGEFQAIVAIRGVWWNDQQLRLPAGCGVIEASRLVNEWRELRLKREAVKQRFGF